MTIKACGIGSTKGGVKCRICGRTFKVLTGHLKSHNLTVKEYLKRFPDAQLFSDETKKKLSVASKGRRVSEETKEKLRRIMNSPEMKQLLSKKLSGKNSPRYKEPIKLICKGCGKVFYVKPKHSNRKYCSRECYLQHNRGWHHSEETKLKLKRIMNSPEVREKIASKLRGKNNPFYGKRHRDETIKKLREQAIQRIANDPEYRRKILEASYKGWLKLTSQLQRYLKEGLPNPSEKKLLEILNKVCPGEYRYNNGWFVLGGKIPDFVNVNGKKKVIELFGEAYHREEEVEERRSHFRKYGWDCLVIWAKELKSPEEVANKVLEFNGGITR